MIFHPTWTLKLQGCFLGWDQGGTGNTCWRFFFGGLFGDVEKLRFSQSFWGA